MHQAHKLEYWSGRCVLVTGATGFLGGWIARTLIDRGANVVLFARNWNLGSPVLNEDYRRRAHLVAGDIASRADVAEAMGAWPVEVVFHMASLSTVGAARERPLEAFNTNVMGTANVLEACRASAMLPRVIVASSAGAYRTTDVTVPIEEGSALEAFSPYEASKLCADIVSRCYARTFGLPVCVTRSQNVYGPGDCTWSRLVPGTVRAVLRGERPVIRSDGKPVRDYLYVDDCVGAHLRLAEAMQDPALHGLAFNLSSERPRSVLEMVREICLALGRPDLDPDVRSDSPGGPAALWCSSRLARERLGWQAEVDLREGLKRTAAWYRDFFARGFPS